jgi:two-component system, NtrC family, nitrogen regulation sensor histidine kinase NtrY
MKPPSPSPSAKPKRYLGGFQFRIIVRVIALALSIGALLWTVMNTVLYATMTILGVMCLLQIWTLIRFAEQTNRHLMRFLESVKYGDTVQMYGVAKLGSSFQELTEAFSAVVHDFERIRVEKEEQYLTLQTILHHVSIGLLSFDELGMVDFINPAARRLLGLTHIRNLATLNAHHKPLADALKHIPEKRKMLVKLVIGEEILQLALSATTFRQRGREITLVSLQNIVNELEEQEIIAWQKLIRVLTHEIMNSVAPITSLAETVSTLLADELPQTDRERDEILSDVRHAISTIARRSAGLLVFVENYRTLSRIPEPNFSIIAVEGLVSDIIRLFEKDAAEKGVRLEQRVESSFLDITADRTLMEQVFINLVKNGIQASSSGGCVTIHVLQSPTGRVIIEVSDIGTGIAEEVIDKIFIPFFTTKPDGSGIGLSFVRQALLKHSATLHVASELGVGTTFSIRF